MCKQRGRQQPVKTPKRRVLDSRGGVKPDTKSLTAVSPLGQLDVPTSGVSAVFGNITATDAMPGWVQAIPSGSNGLISKYSNVNTDHVGQTAANAAIAKLSNGGKFDLYAAMPTHLLFDVAGYFTTASPPPAPAPLSVQITNPVAGTVRGNVSLTASTTGEGVLGVQFKVDGTNVGSEDTTAPYSTPWVSASLRNGPHTISAVVRTASETASATINVTVSNALVTISFDDGWGSQVAAAQEMNARGMKGMFYLLSGYTLPAAQFPAPYMSAEDAQALYAAGNEIGSHTVDHCSLTAAANPGCQNNRTTGLSSTEVVDELKNSKTTLTGLNVGAINAFASPYGDMNSTVLPEVQSRYTTQRGIEDGINYPGAQPLPQYFDPYNLKVRNVFGANGTQAGHVTTTGDDVRRWMAEAIAGQDVASQPGLDNTSWTILLFHDVSSTPASGSMEYSVTPDDFRTFLAIIQASGVRVVTVQQALVESGFTS